MFSIQNFMDLQQQTLISCSFTWEVQVRPDGLCQYLSMCSSWRSSLYLRHSEFFIKICLLLVFKTPWCEGQSLYFSFCEILVYIFYSFFFIVFLCFYYWFEGNFKNAFYANLLSLYAFFISVCGLSCHFDYVVLMNSHIFLNLFKFKFI